LGARLAVANRGNGDLTIVVTSAQSCGPDMKFNFEHTFTIDQVTEDLLNYLETSAIAFEVFMKYC
jgi:hypothetical protein